MWTTWLEENAVRNWAEIPGVHHVYNICVANKIKLLSYTIPWCYVLSWLMNNIHALITPKKRELPANSTCVIKSVSVWIFCTSVKVGALLETEKIASEYWNNRNWLISKTEPFFQKSKRSLFSSLTNFYCFNIHTLITPWKGGFAGQFQVR